MTIRQILALGGCAASLIFCSAAHSGQRSGDVAQPPRPPLTGLNLAGAEFGALPGRYGFDYIYPSDADLDMAAARGFGAIRVPFRWERLQPKLGTEFDVDELALLQSAVERARLRGLAIILDVHNYGRYRGELIGSDRVSLAQFADFWRRLASVFRNQERVIFGIMNEPYGFVTETWVEAANQAIFAIRAAGAHNLILAPGNAYSGAHSWMASDYGTPNSEAMVAISDSCGNTAIEFHQYFDSDSSGSHAECLGPDAAVKALAVATSWLRAHDKKGFLGEFGASDQPACLASLEAALTHVDEQRAYWLGWTYWAAGSWWERSYPLSVQPVNGKDKAQMTILRRHGAPAQAAKVWSSPICRAH
ncbi:MAG: glycoside hydrolase family 5 protein [Methylocystis sp.]|nr:glycoside hydrolase family 5 protein [Methylocystis sp.]